jgi:ribonuclease Z
MKKLFIAALALLTALLIGRIVITPKIVERGFARQVSANIGVDRTADLPDGLHVYVCGAGSPLFDPKRSGPCLGVLAGNQAFVFDAGSGGSGNLGPMGFPLDRVDEIFLTHLHSDHFDGLGQMLLGTWINSNRSLPTPVSGPTGTAEVVAGLNIAYRLDGTYRTAHHRAEIANPQTFGATPHEIVLDGNSRIVHDRNGVRITAYDVTHDPVTPAFGYRIDYKGRSVSISGDTAYDPRIAEVSKDVDVLFHEALNMEMVGTMEQAANANNAPSLAKIMFDIRDYHTSPVDAARTAQQAGATDLVLYHIVPMLPNDALIPMFVKGADQAFDGKITVSKDGTIVRLPAGSDVIIYEQGL